MCEQNDLKFKNLSKEHLFLKKDAKNKEILINSKIKENTKLKGENQEIKNELGDRKKEYESLKACLAESELNLKQATKDNNKLRNENAQIKDELKNRKKEYESLSASLAEKDLNLRQATKDNNELRHENAQIKGELKKGTKEYESLKSCLAESELNFKQATKDNNKLRNENAQIKDELKNRKEEYKSLSASLAEKDLNLKQAISDNYKLNYQNQNITIKNRKMLNKFSIIEKKYGVLNACVKQKNLNLNKKKWFRLLDHFPIFFSLKENFFKNEFKTNIENPNSVSDKEITKKNLNIEYLKNFPSVFSINFRMVTSVIREESSKKGYDLVLDTEKLLSLKFSFPKTEWIGICHVPFELPDWLVKTKAYIPYAKWLTSNEVLRAAKTNCKSLIAFSKDHSEKIQSKTGINTNVIKIPNYEISEKWSWEAFESKSERKIVQVGWWLMRMNAIHIFPDSLYKKIWIHKSDKNADDAFAVEREYLKNRNLFFNYMDESVTVYNHLTAKEYAEIMCSNIAFIHYYDVSAPDFVLECIARHTPILVNPLPAVREYLGDEYPFYYYFYNDAVAKAENKKLVKSAHEYLSQLANKMELIPRWNFNSNPQLFKGHIMKFSIITPSYNSSETIEKAIESVLQQNYNNFEHIVVDGASNDGTVDILKKYSHLKLVVEPDNGQVDAMQKGFQLSSGEIIGNLNTDDYYKPDAFENVLSHFEFGEDFVMGKVEVISEHNQTTWINDPAFEFEKILKHWELNAFCVNPVGYFYRREVQETIPFNLDNDDKHDLEFLIEVAARYKIKKIDVRAWGFFPLH